MIARAKSMISLRGKSESRYKMSNSKSCQSMVTTILMSELRDAYTNIEKKYLDLHKSRMSLSTGGADYAWLVSSKFNKPILPSHERVELERLCETARSDECNLIISHFRARLDRCNRGVDVVRVFKTTVHEVIKSRPVEPAVWLANRLRRSNTNKIDCFGDLVRSEATSTTRLSIHDDDHSGPPTRIMMD